MILPDYLGRRNLNAGLFAPSEEIPRRWLQISWSIGRRVLVSCCAGHARCLLLIFAGAREQLTSETGSGGQLLG
jgi:hypothetical protein